MIKKLGLSTILFFPWLSHAADVRFEITGEIKNTPCQITVVNDNQPTVNLGIYNTASMTQSGHSTDLVEFNIALEQCPADLNNVQFTFTGQSNSVNTQLLAVNAGGADNVGIAIYEDDGKAIVPLNEKSRGRSIQKNTKNMIAFYANYVATGAVTGGEANSTVDFSISYN